MVEQIGKARGPAYALRLEDVAGATVTALCMLCRHEGPVDIPALTARYTRHEPLVRLEEQLRCGRCRARGACRFRIVWGA